MEAPPVIDVPAPRYRGLQLFLAVAVSVGIAVVLFLNEPKGQAFYPRCPMYSMTGLACAGCGAMRAMHQLLHGNLAAAFHFNPLLIVSLPVFAWLAVRVAAREWYQRDLPPREISLVWIWAAGAAVALFSLLRNLPWEPFRWLGP